MADLCEDAKDEIEILEGAYPDRFRFDEASGEAVVMFPTDVCDSGLIQATIGIVLTTPGYPDDAPPKIRVLKSLGMSDEQVKRLLRELQAVALEYQGTPSASPIIAAAQDSIDTMASAGFQCLICLEAEKQPTTAFAPSCGHAFHKQCFAKWIWAFRERSLSSASAQRARELASTATRSAQGEQRDAESLARRAHSTAVAAASRLEAAEDWLKMLKVRAGESPAEAEGAATGKKRGNASGRGVILAPGAGAEEVDGVTLALAIPAVPGEGSLEGVTPADAEAAIARVAGAVRDAKAAAKATANTATAARRRALQQAAATAAAVIEAGPLEGVLEDTPCPACGRRTAYEDAAEFAEAYRPDNGSDGGRRGGRASAAASATADSDAEGSGRSTAASACGDLDPKSRAVREALLAGRHAHEARCAQLERSQAALRRRKGLRATVTPVAAIMPPVTATVTPDMARVTPDTARVDSATATGARGGGKRGVLRGGGCVAKAAPATVVASKAASDSGGSRGRFVAGSRPVGSVALHGAEKASGADGEAHRSAFTATAPLETAVPAAALACSAKAGLATTARAAAARPAGNSRRARRARRAAGDG